MDNPNTFTDEHTPFHAYWLETFTAKGNENGKDGDEARQHRKLVAEAMFNVALAAWCAFHENDADTAHRLYLLSLAFAKRAGLSDPHQTIAPAGEKTATQH